MRIDLSTRTAAVFALACGAAAGLLATGSRPPAPRADELRVQDRPFHLEPPAGEPFLLTEARWLSLPELRGDFDLHAEVELGPGAVLDLLLRRVEPRYVQGVNLPFHGRFTVLRLGTGTAGPPWRTPAEALFGEPGGVPLAPGLPATVSVRARGRALAANVAGRRLEPVCAADEHGALAFAARGGAVAVRRLDIEPVPREAGLPPWLFGLAGALPAVLLGVRRRRAAVRLAIAGALLVLAAEVARRIGFAGLPPLAHPDLATERLVALAGAPLALAACARGRLLAVAAPLCLLAAAVPAWLAARTVAERFPPAPELDAVFGPRAGDQLAHALARRIAGPLAVHTLEPSSHRILLLGGQLLYRRGAAPDEHLEPLLLGELRPALPDVQVAALATEDGWSRQQWELFERCYAEYRPRALVLGVPADEAWSEEGEPPRSSPEALAEVVAAARAHCAAHGCALVLLADVGLPAPLRAVLRGAAEEGVPLVELAGGVPPAAAAGQLAEALLPLLQG